MKYKKCERRRKSSVNQFHEKNPFLKNALLSEWIYKLWVNYATSILHMNVHKKLVSIVNNYYVVFMGMPFTESDWIFNFQSVSVKFTPLYRGHDFYRKWLNFLCWISASFCKTHLIIWWCMNFTESDWNSGNTVATISASFCKIHALYIRSEFYRKWLKFYSVTRSKLFN